MALSLFKKLEYKGFFAVESITLLYNVFTAILIFVLFPRMDHPIIMLIGRVVIAAITFGLLFLYRKFPYKGIAFIRIAFQMSLLAYWYPDTYEFNRLFPNLDCYFASAEQFLFHCQPSVEFSKVCPSIWFSEPFNLGYFSYYPLIAIVTVFFFFYQFKSFEKVSFMLVTAFFIYYLIYIFIPVAGPQFYFPAVGMDKINAGIFPAIGDYFNTNDVLLPGPGYDHGFFYNMVEASQEVGERPTAAFPSSHVGISTIAMILAFKAKRKLGYILLPFYILLCCATVYIQAHYLIDVIAGWISAIIIYKLTEIAYNKWFISEPFKLK
ncbi:MAG: phosphatase PAP2 family protein [Phocaeicola sp.]|uniref:phosphatase PAP2 family protein n=1 Tax=Phocaeicola TaxID=909656 RepID=UPI00234EBFC0|nr:phosphatase PAP2 family protein [Phocaeicola oris]MCE2617473.1 phosphatase PAP2 family protein [Phocaeicola oris]